MKVCFYFQVHQPMRLRRFSPFENGGRSLFDLYFDSELNKRLLEKVAAKCYFPTNDLILSLLDAFPDFKVSFSLTGVFIEQCRMFMPSLLDSFKELGKNKRVDFLSETYYHSLSSLFEEKMEFLEQVRMHGKAMKELGKSPKVFRNTEAIFSNEIASLAESEGYDGIMTEGLEQVLGWRSPNYIYSVRNNSRIKALLRHYRLSDDIGYRFSARWWSGYPLTAEKYAGWLSELQGDCVNIFMDYETFGEHQWEDTGIFEFLSSLPREILKHEHLEFATPSELTLLKASGEIDVPHTISWADMERDTSAWLGNEMQRSCFMTIKNLEGSVKETGDEDVIRAWRLLQNSDHLYYLSTKSLSDQDVHNYFSPYDNPFDGFINFMNILQDLKGRTAKE